MTNTAAFYHEQADACTRAADEAVLANVRERCLRSATAWRLMAERHARGELVQAELAAAKAAKSRVDGIAGALADG